VAILALSATTKPVYDLSVHLLRAAGLPTSEMTASTLFTAVFMGAFALALPFGLAHGVAVLALTTITLQIIFAAWARWRVLNHLDVTPSGGAYAPTAGAG
jgi:O-antigen/teichoic acid export membrane protein